MKKIFVLIALLIFMCGCSEEKQQEVTFTLSDNGNYVTDTGVEYIHISNEGNEGIYYIGKLKFYGSVEGETAKSQHMGISYKTGFYFINGDKTKNILIRRTPNNEWCSIYRKTTLPAVNLSVDNCSSIVMMTGLDHEKREENFNKAIGKGISDKSEIAVFLQDVRNQKNPIEAGLYDLVRKTDGSLENCYMYGTIYGLFEEEPNLVVAMQVTSYNDLAYSVTIGNENYVLPAEWIDRLQFRK